MKELRGGRRAGSGRKRIHSPGVSHRTRELISHRTPLHVNFKFKRTIRNKISLRLLKRAIVRARRCGLKVIHFSLQSNHIHLILEAQENSILTKGMRSLTITFAKGLAKGKIQKERYHLHVLRSRRETRNAVRYVLFNQQRHEKGTYSEINEYSSVYGRPAFIRQFSKQYKMILRIGKGEIWVGENPGTWLLCKAIKELSATV